MTILVALLAPTALAGTPAPAPAAEPSPFVAPAYGAPLPAELLAAMAQDAPAADADPRWTGSVSLGVTITSGNSNLRSAAATADAELRRDDASIDDRTTLSAFWNYADAKDDETNERELTQRQLGGKAQYDYFFADDLYGYGNVAGLYDAKKNLELRLSLGAGLGYQVFEVPDERSLSVEAGLAYVDENYEGSAFDEEYAAGRFAYAYSNQLSESTHFGQNGEVTVSLEEADDTIARLDTRLRTQMSESFFVMIQYVLEYDNTPAIETNPEDADFGQRFDRIDHKVILTLGWQF
jgi:putative salt-induced outer membrane protein YdiY